MTIKKKSGFTLLEILIGMSLLSVMMLLLFASLRVCVQNWNAGEKKIAQVSQRAIVQNFFQSKLHGTLPLEADFFEEKQFSFQGNAEQLQFVGSLPASTGKLGIQLFSLSLEDGKDNEGLQLKVAIRPFFPIGEEGDEEEWDEEGVIILKKIQELRFSYYGLDEESEEDPAWQEEWLEKTMLPKMVSIDIELTNGDVWPQVVVALKIDASEAAISGGDENPFNSTGISNGKFIR